MRRLLLLQTCGEFGENRIDTGEETSVAAKLTTPVAKTVQ